MKLVDFSNYIKNLVFIISDVVLCLKLYILSAILNKPARDPRAFLHALLYIVAHTHLLLKATTLHLEMLPLINSGMFLPVNAPPTIPATVYSTRLADFHHRFHYTLHSDTLYFLLLV